MLLPGASMGREVYPCIEPCIDPYMGHPIDPFMGSSTDP